MSPDREKSEPRLASAEIEIACAVASLRTGLLDEHAQEREREQLAGLAATLPDLFGTLDTSCLDRISERLGGGDGDGRGFAEILVISDSHVHVIQPLPGRPGSALLAVCAADCSIGLVLSALRTRASLLEDE